MNSVNFTKKLRNGWSLGNSFDCFKAPKESYDLENIDTETLWHNPKTTKDLIKFIKKSGFNLIRIPVSWHDHIDPINNSIELSFLNRVKEIVDWCYDENLYVIINCHHDCFCEKDLVYHHGYCLSEKVDLKVLSIKFLKDLWAQIADIFKDYDDKLIFEVLNEPRAIGEPYEWYIPDQKVYSTYRDIIIEYEKACIKTIRSMGGENKNRFIMVPTYCADYKSLPWPINALKDDKLILSIHSYAPHNMCLLGKETSFNDEEIEEIFKNLSSLYTSEGIGVIIGEFGASNKGNDKERLKLYEKYASLSKEYNIPIILWDNGHLEVEDLQDNNLLSGNCFGHLDRKNLKWQNEDLIKAIIS